MKKIFLILLVAAAGVGSFALFFPPNDTVDMVGEKRECLDCHRQRNINTNEGVVASNAFCMECHAQPSCKRDEDGTEVSLQVPAEAFAGTPHNYSACIHCHDDVARSPHRSAAGVQCMECHTVHGEKAAGDPHLRVRCEACHMESRFVELDRESDTVRLAKKDDQGVPVNFTEHKMSAEYGEDFCLKCHFEGNSVGAAAMVLPGKSLLCVMCHNAPLVVGHWMFRGALAVLLIGLFAMIFLWFQGSVAGERTSTHRKAALAAESVWDTIFSGKIRSVLSTLFFDVLLQRRILKESVKRWTIHSMIYLAFLGRLALSLFTMILYGLNPDGETTLALMDKNHWFTASVNDFLGLLIVLGVLWAAAQRFVSRPKHVLSEEQDNLTLLIIGLLTLSGFALEGARIHVTGVPAEIAVYSFVGYAVAQVWGALSSSNGQQAYGVLWYVHGALWVAFLVYLPFSKLRHIITAPLNLIIRGDEKKE
jgi:nitrate reductase gamma subunit